jgi:phage terminase small subunit
MSELTAKQQRFVEAYLANPNGARAAIAAGYSAKTARVIASENLRKPAIAAALAEAQRRRKEREQGLIERVREELAGMAFSNIKDILDEDKRVIEPSAWPARLRGMIHYEKRETIRHTRDGRTEHLMTKIRVKMPRKLKALEMLGKSLGMFSPRRREDRG